MTSSPDRLVDYFQTPTDPDGYTQEFPKSSLRNIDYSALEYDTLHRATIEYIKTYHRDKFNDFMASNGFMMLTELVCYVGSVLSQRADILANESFLPTAFTENAVTNHLELIGQEFKRQTPSTVQIMCTVDSPVATDIRIKTNGQTNFQISGPDGQPIIYEVFSAPYDWSSDIVIPAKKYGIVAWGIEGKFASTVNLVSSGGNNQEASIVDENILDSPIIVNVDNNPWTRVKFVEDYGPNDKVFAVRFEEGRAIIKFGDNDSGAAPIAGQNISIRYRVGGGIKGRINVDAINQTRAFQPDFPSTAVVPVRFRNVVPSMGGYDKETINQAKARAPKSWATHDFIATSIDYANESSFFNHPVYGSILRSAATVHTSINANVVRVSVLAEGANGLPSTPSQGLKNALASYLSEKNVLTDDIDVVDGKIRNVDLDMNVVVFRNVDASSVKGEVDSAIDEFFDISNWDMGKPFYVSELYEQIASVNGVKYVDIFSPADDILPQKHLEPEKIEDSSSYQQAKECLSNSPYDINFVDYPNYRFLMYITTPGVRLEDIKSWAVDNCGLYLSCGECVGIGFSFDLDGEGDLQPTDGDFIEGAFGRTSNNNLYPVEGTFVDDYFEVDNLDDIMPMPIYNIVPTLSSATLYEFHTYNNMSGNVVSWDELITIGNKDIRIYYEK